MDDKKSKLIAKALTDAKFKAELAQNPNAVIEKELGVKIPAGVSVKVVEDSASVVHLVLPQPAKADAELSDKDLGKVSGGAAIKTLGPCIDQSSSYRRC